MTETLAARSSREDLVGVVERERGRNVHAERMLGAGADRVPVFRPVSPADAAGGRSRRRRPPSRNRTRRLGPRARCRQGRSARDPTRAFGLPPMSPGGLRRSPRKASGWPSRARSIRSAVRRSSSPDLSGPVGEDSRSARRSGVPSAASDTAAAVADAHTKLAAQRPLGVLQRRRHALRAGRCPLHDRSAGDIGSVDGSR